MLKRLKQLLNPFDAYTRCTKQLVEELAELKDEIREIRLINSKTFESVITDYRKYAEEQRQKAEFYSYSLTHIGDLLPDMIWMKWKDGKYVYANKAIRDGLLFDDNPVNKDDTEIGTNAAKFFGKNRHNFGEYCSGSDVITIEHGHRKRFIEYGMSGGKPLVLEVYKNVVKTGNTIIATVGCGRDITHNIFTMLKLEELAEDTDLELSKSIMAEYLDEYLFENPGMSETLRDFYHKHKEMYYAE